MSTTSWTITSNKRKAKASTPAPRKRQRFGDTSDGKRSGSRLRNQQTLTQAQWMTPSPDHLADESFLHEGQPPRTLPQMKSKRKLKTRNSTLTQMDFFNMAHHDPQDIDDSLLVQNHMQHAEPVPAQFDGAYSSPRKPRRSKVVPDSRPQPRANEGMESQEYKPSKKKRVVQEKDQDVLSSDRRTSNRLASKKQIFSDPDQSFDYFNSALTTPSRVRASGSDPSPRRPRLEIKDSTEWDEEIRLSGLPHHLRTPIKDRTIILSSQSPESLPPSTQKHARNDLPRLVPGRRTPLADRCTNSFPTSPSRSAKRRPLSKSHYPAKKIVVLKLPKRREANMEARVEDSQKNLWSIPSSSPQLDQKRDSVFPPIPPFPKAGQSSNEAEIPATSQSHPVRSSPPATFTQESLPDITTLTGRPSVHTNEEVVLDNVERTAGHLSPKFHGETDTIVRDFALTPTRKPRGREDQRGVTSAAVPIDQTQIQAPADSEILVVEDSEAEDVVSPIKLSLHKQAYRSPTLHMSTHRLETTDAGSQLSSPSRQLVQEWSAQESSTVPVGQLTDVLSTPLPAPRLVPQSVTKQRQQAQKRLEIDEDEVALPDASVIHRASAHVSTQLIPLNDISSTPSSSSLPSAKATTQKSVNPASMPHPSQISTQDATQAFFQMSSSARPFPESWVEEHDRVTIKDSSSWQVSMSQLQQHVEATQSQVRIDLGLDEVFNSDDDEDLDLNPPSTAPPEQSDSFRHIHIERTPTVKRHVDVLDRTEHVSAKPGDADLDEHERQSQPHHHVDEGNSKSPRIPSSQQSVSMLSSPGPPPLQRQYDPLPGFDNDTQSNFTQNGHITAAYVHRQREAGCIPDWYTPKPFQVPGFTRRK